MGAAIPLVITSVGFWTAIFLLVRFPWARAWYMDYLSRRAGTPGYSWIGDGDGKSPVTTAFRVGFGIILVGAVGFTGLAIWALSDLSAW
jgi:hypothetical protein